MILMYHYVRHSRPVRPGTVGLTVEEFERQVVSLKDEPGVVFTFDDGLREHHDICAPILEEHGLRGVFFPIGCAMDGIWPTTHLLHAAMDEFGTEALIREYDGTLVAMMQRMYAYEPDPNRRALKFAVNGPASDAVMRSVIGNMGLTTTVADWFMNGSEVASLARRGHTIGSHGYQHEPLTRMGITAALADVQRGQLAIMKHNIDFPRAFAWPFGQESEDLADVMRERFDVLYGTAERTDACELVEVKRDFPREVPA